MTTTKNQLTIGIDLGDRRHAVCVLDNKGQILTEETLPNTRAGLAQLSQRYPGATLAMETGTHCSPRRPEGRPLASPSASLRASPSSR